MKRQTYQSESKITTVSAVCKFKPRPPARVDKMKMKYGESGALNFANKEPRSSPLNHHVINTLRDLILLYDDLLGTTVETQVHVAPQVKVIFEQCHYRNHLSKQQNTMTSCFQLRESLVEQLKLARDTPQIVIHFPVIFQEQVRVIANLSQLHQRVHQAFRADLALGVLHGVRSTAQNLVVDLALPSGHVALENFFDFFWQLTLDLFLQTTQQERTQDLVQTINDQKRLFFGHFDFFSRRCKWCVEPLFKIVNGVENVRQQVVQ
jgi:hypothetical protein